MVSVIVPIYNVEKYLRQCLDSVLDQTYTDFEMILVDDGSTDASGKICDDYARKDSRITVIHKENGGQSIARNMGMDVSRGEYIYFLDSDDYIRNDTLEKLIFIANEADFDIVFFDGHNFYDGIREPTVRTNFVRSKDYGTASGIDMIFELRKNGDFYYGVQFLLFRREFFLKYNLRFYPGIIFEDVLFTVMAFIKAEKVVHLHEALYSRRLRPNSTMTSEYDVFHFHSHYVSFRELFLQYINSSEGSKEKAFLEDFLCKRSFTIVKKYYFRLNKEEQQQAQSEMEEIKQLLASVDYFGKMGLKFDVNCKLPIQGFISHYPALYKLYKIAILPAKALRRKLSF